MRVLSVARLVLGVAGVVAGLGARLRRRALLVARRVQRPSSKTTSRLTDSVVSPGETGVVARDSAASIAIIIGGIGRLKPPPSEMLAMRRTRMPSASAY